MYYTKYLLIICSNAYELLDFDLTLIRKGAFEALVHHHLQIKRLNLLIILRTHFLYTNNYHKGTEIT